MKTVEGRVLGMVSSYVLEELAPASQQLMDGHVTENMVIVYYKSKQLNHMHPQVLSIFTVSSCH